MLKVTPAYTGASFFKRQGSILGLYLEGVWGHLEDPLEPHRCLMEAHGLTWGAHVTMWVSKACNCDYGPLP